MNRRTFCEDKLGQLVQRSSPDLTRSSRSTSGLLTCTSPAPVTLEFSACCQADRDCSVGVDSEVPTSSCPRQGSALDNNARPSPFASTPKAEERHKYEGSVVTLNPRRRLCLRCAAGNAPGEPSPGADVGGARPVPAQMWAGARPVPAQMWQRWAPTRCRLGGRAPACTCRASRSGCTRGGYPPS